MNDRTEKKGADFAESLIREMFAAEPLFAYVALVTWAKIVMKTFEERQRELRRPPGVKELFQVMDEVTPKVFGDLAIASRSAEGILAEAMEETKGNKETAGQGISGKEAISRDALREILRFMLGQQIENVPSRYRGIAEAKTAEILPEIRSD